MLRLFSSSRNSEERISISLRLMFTTKPIVQRITWPIWVTLSVLVFMFCCIRILL
ncbi:hypothetical protein LINPERPRIM_LOCUS21884 [Linum perenne]